MRLGGVAISLESQFTAGPQLVVPITHEFFEIRTPQQSAHLTHTSGETADGQIRQARQNVHRIGAPITGAPVLLTRHEISLSPSPKTMPLAPRYERRIQGNDC
jgi:hypothetical protein